MSKTNWKGTLTEYAKSTRNSCWRCLYCDSDGGCSKKNTVISLVGANYYKYCSHYTAGSKDPIPTNEDKILDRKEYEKTHPREVQKKADNPLESSSSTVSTKTVTFQRPKKKVGKVDKTDKKERKHFVVTLKREKDAKVIMVAIRIGSWTRYSSNSAMLIPPESLLAKSVLSRKLGYRVEYRGDFYKVIAYK